jgi:hypothetical protein
MGCCTGVSPLPKRDHSTRKPACLGSPRASPEAAVDRRAAREEPLQRPPKSLRELPKSLRELPKSLRELPQRLESLPERLRELSKSLRELPKPVERLPERL